MGLYYMPGDTLQKHYNYLIDIITYTIKIFENSVTSRTFKTSQIPDFSR